MTNQNSTEIKSTLTDEQIVAIAQMIDQLILDVGKQYAPSGIEFAAIALGRLMVFTKHVDCFNTFQDMMTEIVNMREPEPLIKPQDVQ
jgi:hypothetical protein